MFEQIPEQVNFALGTLNKEGFHSHIVGGAVRDIIMGYTPDDYDITTSALPEETEKVFSEFHCFETGIKHGTVTVVIEKFPLEITTYRIEGTYSDNRHPDKVSFTDNIVLDLSRRDFTCNAIAYSPKTGLMDPFDGQKDIENKIIRCVGDPDTRFNEDALRILRALRFSSTLAFDIDPSTQNSIKKNYRLLSNVSNERIFVEMKKLLCGKNAGNLLREYDYVFFFLFPELKETKGCTQNHERHIYDVWNHIIKSVEESEAIPEIRFAMLFHDIGKPDVKSTDFNGVDHFYNHSKISTEKAKAILNRLKVSNKFKDDVLTLIEYHDFVPDKITEKTYRKYIGKLGKETVLNLFKIREADVRAQSAAFLGESLRGNQTGLEKVKEILEKESCFSLRDLEVNGTDLINAGLSEGPELKTVLSKILDDVLSGNMPNNKDTILKKVKEGKYND